MRGRGFGLLAALVAVGVLAAAAWWHFDPGRAPKLIAGLVRQTEIRIAPEVNGRLADIRAQPGQHVKKGDVLVELDNPDLVAALGEAKAAEASARAERDHVFSGVRPEEIAIAVQAVETAEANLTLAEQQNVRAKALSAQSFASRADLDESNASLAKAEADLDLKRAQRDEAKTGPTAEEQALADARVALASAAVADAETRLAKTRLVAPADGVVALRIAEPGEVVLPGRAVMTLKPDGDAGFPSRCARTSCGV